MDIQGDGKKPRNTLVRKKLKMPLVVRTDIEEQEFKDGFRRLCFPIPRHPPGFVCWPEWKVVDAYQRGIKSVIDLHTPSELEALTRVPAAQWSQLP